MYRIHEWDDISTRVMAGERIVVIEESPEYPGHLTFQVMDQESFVRTYSEYLSRYSLLSELFTLSAFVTKLETDGWEPVFLTSAADLILEYEHYSQPLIIDNLKLPHGLFGFQQYSLNRALERAVDQKGKVSGFFFNWSPGSGKGSVAAAGAQELWNRGEIDLVLFFTLRRMKINMARRMEDLTELRAEIAEGTALRRRKRYAAAEAQCYVLNYEKAHFDLEPLSDLIRGTRVLFVLDEVQKVLFDENGSPTRARAGLQKLMRESKKSIVWPMSGSVVKHSPVRYHDVFRVQEMRGRNPLGSKEDFIENYSFSHETVPTFGNDFELVIRWNQAKLAEVPHQVSALTQSVRKTSPGVREFFKDMTTEVIPVQMSVEDRTLYDVITDDARGDRERMSQYYQLLRYVCNTPESLRRSASELAPIYLERYPQLITSRNCAKLDTTCELLDNNIAAGDKTVVFSHHTHLSLFLIADELTRRGITYVLHYGTGQTDKQGQQAQDDFMTDDSISVFLSSDAGAYGLNLQAARYVINYDIPYDPDTLTQRNDRIDRADSHLTGLTSYVLMTEDTLEERIWSIQEKRRALSATVQGTVENLSRMDAQTYREMSEAQAIPELMFGGTRSSLMAR